MTDYPFNMQLAVTSLDENTVVRDASVSIYDPADLDGTTLLTLTTPSGVPLPNPLMTNQYGIVQPFIATLPQVMWRSGDFEGYFESYKGLRDEAAAAADAAAASALLATEYANGLGIGTVETGVDPAATLTGTAPDRLLNFVLPQGPEGPEGPPGTAGPLDGLTDVTAPSPTNGQALIWDSATSQWKNTTLTTPSSTLDSLSDVDTAGVTDTNVLAYDSATSTWKPKSGTAAPATIRTTSSNYGSGNTTASITIPATAAVYDLLVISVHGEWGVSNTNVSGWTFHAAANGANTGVSVFSKIAGAGDPGTVVNFTMGGTGAWEVMCAAVKDADGLKNFTVRQSSSGSTLQAIDNLTGIGADDRVLMFAHSRAGNQTVTWNAGTAVLTRATDAILSSTLWTHSGVTSIQPTASSTGSPTGLALSVVIASGSASGPGDDLVQTSTYNPTATGFNGSTSPALKVVAGGNNTGAALEVNTTAATVQKMGLFVNVANVSNTGSSMAVGRAGAYGAAWDRYGTQTRVSELDMTFGGSSTVPVDTSYVQSGAVIHYGGLIWVKRGTGSTNFNVHPLGYAAYHSTKTANYTLVYSDALVIFNGSSLTATLPDPTTSGISGRSFWIKNVHSTALTVVSAGTSKTIDGAASISLAQNESVIVTTDSTQWLINASKAGGTGHNIGDDLIQTGTYNPTVTGPTSGTQPLLNVQIAPGSRTGPILRVGTTTAGTQSGNPQGIRIDKQGTGPLISAGNSSTSSITHFEVDSNGFITRMNNRDNFYFGPMDAGSTPEGTVTGKYGLYVGQGGGWNVGDRPGRLYHKAWHHSYADGWVAVGANTDFQIKTANYTVAVMDELIIGNGSTVTITLPDPAQIIMGGRIYRVKNINAAALTVVSAGTSKTIDGAASKSLNQWDKITVTSDGTQWLII